MNDLYYTKGFPNYDHFYKGTTSQNPRQLTDFATDFDHKLPPLKLEPINKSAKPFEAATEDAENELAARIIAINRSKLPAINTQRSEDESEDDKKETPAETVGETKKTNDFLSRTQRILCIIGTVTILVIIIVVGKCKRVKNVIS